MDTTPTLLNYYMLDHYDPDSCRLVLENMIITITKDTVHDMLGLPNEGEDFLSMTSCEKDNQVLQEWKSQYDKKGFNGEEYLKRIKNTKQDNLMFRLNFLTLFINTFVESTLSGTNQINVVNKLVMAYVAVIEHSYGIILSEKKNIEKALKNGIEKFQDNLMLKEWYEKNQELFKEVNKAGNGGMNSNEAGFDGHRKEGESDGGKEEQFYPIRGLVVDGDLHDDGGVCEEDDGNGKMGKIEQKIHVYGKSPFVERIVKIGDKMKKDEITLYNSVFSSKRDYGEETWNIGSGHVLHQGFAYHFKSNTFIHAIIIDCWLSLLNRMEELRDVGSVSSIFFDTNFLKRYWVDQCHLMELKNCLMILHLKSLPKPEKLKDIGLVLFPIVDKSTYYMICFDLRVPTYYIIDHVNRNGAVEDIYGIKHIRVKKWLGNYLKTENYQKSTTFNKIKARVMKMPCKVEKEGSDCGRDVVALNNLRIKYMARLMKSEYNKHKSMLEKDAEEYERLDPLQKLAVMNEVKEIREKQRRGRRRF
ncbi:unnamed protein product [Lactuca saligna]|uniref:Ubiquitin-like protease family profile domain-containing protein n=1 Tax=Lactuca saligna TaxID=75948 RepID=A0AA36E7G7_LACSI|nr:unnamed protein product [Lactuca saligna]